MKILVTNDDGIFTEGLWTLVKELNKIARVIVVAPDREQSAIGTAVTLSQPLRVQRVRPVVPEVEAYSVEGTPADSVILALEKLVKDEIALVISGVNQGLNLGNDVLISGTVGAALQGYLRGLPAIAISVSTDDSLYLDNGAKLAALLAEQIISNVLPSNIFLNVNLPELSLAKVRGVKFTHLASESHTDTIEEGHDGRRKYYWLVRQKISQDTDEQTDVGAIMQDNISITPLSINPPIKSSPPILDGLVADLLGELQQY